MSSPIYPWATCFFTRNEEVRNVTSGVLVDCLSGGGGGVGRGGQRWQPTEKAKGRKNLFSLCSCFFCINTQATSITEPRWHTKKCMRLASGTSPSHPCMQPSDPRLPPWDPEIPKGTSFKETASSAATPHRMCQFSLTQKGDLNCCRFCVSILLGNMVLLYKGKESKSWKKTMKTFI